MIGNDANFGMQKIKIISSIVLVGFTLSVIYHYINSNYLGLQNYPNNTFLFDPTDKFNDFFNIYNASIDLNPYRKSVSVYFPFTYIVMFLHTLLNKWVAFALWAFSFISFLFFYLYKNITTSNIYEKIVYIFILIFMSYPTLFIIDRGNLETWVFISLVLFVYFFYLKNQILSALFLSVAISFKLYPCILGLLFLMDKRYREIFLTFFITGLLTFSSMLLLKGGIIESYEGLIKCLADFNKYYLNSSHGLQHNTSLFAPIKGCFYFFVEKFRLPENLGQLINTFYFVIAMLIFSSLSYLMFRFRFSSSNGISLLIISFLLLPQISYDYKLINLYIPLILFINSQEKQKFDNLTAIIFGLLLIPKDYYLLRGDISIATVINPLLLIMLASIILHQGIFRVSSRNEL